MESPLSELPFRALPSVDLVLRSKIVGDLLQTYTRDAVVRLVRQVLQVHRSAMAAGAPAPSLEIVLDDLKAHVEQEWTVRPVGVINASGVILHTNLGRAPLSAEAVQAAQDAAAYCDLEYDLATGERGSRQDAVRSLLIAITGAEAAHVSVNNAAAVTVLLATLARGKEVIVSRGQSVEIGGGFRVPVILRQSGARLVEVGTTNRTRLVDYESAITERTAAILHVHSSNFRIVGFTESVELGHLAELAHRHGLLLIDDNGSGALLETAAFGLAHEPTPVEALEAGADLVAFSADKLLGGPQAGIMLGRAALVQLVARHPLARATRPDKLTLAALSATLLTYLKGEAAERLPVWRMIRQTREDLTARAAAWQQLAAKRGIEVTLREGESTVGGGSLPNETLPTTLIALPRSLTASSLRAGMPPIIARTQGRTTLLDLRTVDASQESSLLEAVCTALHTVDAQKVPVVDSGTA